METSRKRTTSGGRAKAPTPAKAASPPPPERTGGAADFVEIRPGFLVNPAQVVMVRLIQGGVDPNAYATMNLANGAEETLTRDAFWVVTGREPTITPAQRYRGPMPASHQANEPDNQK